MTRAAKSTPTLRGQTLERAPVSRSTLEDPLYVSVNPSSLYDVAWAATGREYELTTQYYEPVRPEELEHLPGGSYFPKDKDFGVRFYFDAKADVVRVGQCILMRVPKRLRAERIAQENERMRAFKPTKSDAGEQSNLKDEGLSTVKDELKS